jgi:hypothetical protein
LGRAGIYRWGYEDTNVRRINIKEAINIGGNIASITAISLLWLQTLSGKVDILIAAPILVIAALLAIGLSALGWFLLTLGYQRFAMPSSTRSGNAAARIAYAGLAGGTMLLVLVSLLSFIYVFAAIAVRTLAVD